MLFGIRQNKLNTTKRMYTPLRYIHNTHYIIICGAIKQILLFVVNIEVCRKKWAGNVLILTLG